MFDARYEAVLDRVKIGDLVERLKLARFGPLAVIHVEKREPILRVRDGGGYAAVHAAAYQYDCKFLVHECRLPR